METVILVVHLLLALTLIGVVLMQRSEGGGLGMGGGGGAATGRPAPSPLGRVTWALAIAFIATSLALTILAAQQTGTGSVLDRITDTGAAAGEEVPDSPADDGTGLLPPVPLGDGLLPDAGGEAAPPPDLAPGTDGGLAPDAGLVPDVD